MSQSRAWVWRPHCQRGEVENAMRELEHVYRTRRTFKPSWRTHIEHLLDDAERRADALLEGLVWC